MQQIITPPSKNEIVVYQPDATLRLEAVLVHETIWLNRQQLAQLFGRDVKTIGKHIANALNEELSPNITSLSTVHSQGGNQVVAKFATTAADGKSYQVEYYSLEMITSVGYRVKSPQGVAFRRWATSVLREYLLRGYAVNTRIDQLEERIDRRLASHDREIAGLNDRVDFFVRTELPPREGVLFEGQIKDGYDLALKIIRQAKKSVVLIDNYIDERVLTMLESRGPKATATIYTKGCSRKLQLDVAAHNRQYRPIHLVAYRGSHDRFLIVDSTVYHIGASLKDLGMSLFAFSKMEIPASLILSRLPPPTGGGEKLRRGNSTLNPVTI